MKLIFDKKNIFNQFLLFKTWRRAVWRFKFYQIFIKTKLKKTNSMQTIIHKLYPKKRGHTVNTKHTRNSHQIAVKSKTFLLNYSPLFSIARRRKVWPHREKKSHTEKK